MQVATLESDNLEQARQIADRAAGVLAEGGLVVLPTETVYGVAASAASEAGVEALRELKAQGRPRAFTVHLPDARAAWRYVHPGGAKLGRLARKAFPGPITLVAEVDDTTIQQKVEAMGLPADARDRIYFEGAVGLRCPDHALTQRILAAVDAPVLASSANLHGQPPPHDAEQALTAIGDRVDLVVDGGRCRYARPSTIVRLSGEGARQTMRVEREGVFDERFVRKLLRWTVLIVCSGNTCRSPMAEVMAREILAQRRGVAPRDLETAGIRVLSAGVSATPGMPAAREAVEAMSRRAAAPALRDHRSRALTRELIHEADVVYCMTRAHCQTIQALAPASGDKVQRLDPAGDIQDPLGSNASAYEQTARTIYQHLERRLKEQRP